MSQAYIASERWIHADLLVTAGSMVAETHNVWRRYEKIDPLFFTWPAVRIKTDAGEPHEGVTGLELPHNRGEWPVVMRRMVERTKAYALLLVEQKEAEVKAIFESQHGSRCWTIPIKGHGNVKILGETTHRDNVESVGLLWSPRRASA